LKVLPKCGENRKQGKEIPGSAKKIPRSADKIPGSAENRELSRKILKVLNFPIEMWRKLGNREINSNARKASRPRA
jgi:hypothetical protein